MTLIPVKIKDGSLRNSIGQLVSVSHKTEQGFKSWCYKELSKVEGGLDGLIKTDKGYTNKYQNTLVDTTVDTTGSENEND